MEHGVYMLHCNRNIIWQKHWKNIFLFYVEHSTLRWAPEAVLQFASTLEFRCSNKWSCRVAQYNRGMVRCVCQTGILVRASSITANGALSEWLCYSWHYWSIDLETYHAWLAQGTHRASSLLDLDSRLINKQKFLLSHFPVHLVFSNTKKD